ncbi:prepilin peptidase [Clostridiaceae bacterium 35-E11]
MWVNLLLILVLLICAITDLKSRKIYNKVIFPSLFLAFSLHLFHGGWERLFSSIEGFFMGFSLLLIPYLFGGIGAGDVKLLALIGALKGVSFVLYTAVYMSILGSILALLILIWGKPAFSNLKSLCYYLIHLKSGLKTSFPFEKKNLSVSYPYGIAIAGGAILQLLLEGSVVLW